MRLLISLLVALTFVNMADIAARDLIVINTLGETADYVKLDDSTITQNVATLGLAPNDFIVTGTTGIALNSTSNDLYFFNLPAMTSIGTLFLGASRNPYNGAVAGNDTMLVTNLLASTITKVKVSNRSLIGEYPTGKSPEGIVVDGMHAFICCTALDFGDFTYGQGTVQVFDMQTNQVTDSIRVGTNPQDIVKAYDGLLYVICTGDYFSQFGILYRIDPVTNTMVDSLAIGSSPGSVAVTRDGTLFLAAGGFSGHGEIYTVDLSSFTIIHGPGNPIYTDLGVTSVVTVSDSSVVSCNFTDDTITEITSGGTVLSRFHTGDGPVVAAKFPLCSQACGDADGSGGTPDISDAVFLIAFIFGGGPHPPTIAAGDMNCDNQTDISDAVALIDYIFGGGPGSCGCAD